ncbi:probable serine/threonine-protein kinase WNK6 [Impatiens glandulifera]|uniref:probable serine/threonine-protein kinase WNK6 n=1 Tax=Impatiens glandulifera TaxID=253017 RepID=UPI001FB19AB1|nr:probable serine/threonine-protein kinase WNK6 [Impatiens glandulifera]
MDLDDSDIAEKSPTGRFIRYDQVLSIGTEAAKVVYRGFDTVAGKEVDWSKVKMDKSTMEEKFLDDLEARISVELQTLKSLKHPNILKTRASWLDRQSGVINIVAEAFSSGTLRQFRKKHKGVDLTAVKNWGKQILVGLLYLHSHNPAVIHGDLNCDNVFINGNTGEVKIGAIGLATAVTQKKKKKQEEEEEAACNNDKFLMDIYSFGLCILELVTCEIPFSECKDDGSWEVVYGRKIGWGSKPESLKKVGNILVKEFIERCICCTRRRTRVEELLKDALFSCEICPLSECEYRCSNEKKEFKLSGEQGSSENVILLRLLLIEQQQQLLNDGGEEAKKKIEFMFDLSADTTVSVAGEMVDDLGLAVEDVALIAELMDRVIASMHIATNYKQQ